EDDPLGGQVDDEVAGRVRRPDIDEVCVDAVQVERQALVDERLGGTELDAGEVPVGETAGEGRDGRVAAAARVPQRLHELRPLLAELGGAEPVADDLGVGEELVSPAVVAVPVRVDHPSRRRLPHTSVGIDHLPGVRQVPERVDDEPAAAVEESRVARPEAAVRLQAGIDVAGELAELHSKFDVTSCPTGGQLPSAVLRGRVAGNPRRMALHTFSGGPIARATEPYV